MALGALSLLAAARPASADEPTAKPPAPKAAEANPKPAAEAAPKAGDPKASAEAAPKAEVEPSERPKPADEPKPTEAAKAEVEEGEPEAPGAGVARPAPRDDRTGTFLIRLQGGATSPIGRLASGLYFDHVVSGGGGLRGALGVGIGRSATLELSGGWAYLAGASGCVSCSGSTFDAGLGLVYHPVQALAFDPSLGFSMGYRGTLLDGTTTARPLPRSLSGALFHGFDFARVTLAGEFYPSPKLGFGPALSLDVGAVLDGPQAGSLGSIYTVLQAGLRISIDPLRRAPARSASTASAVGSKASRARP
jgi:hypothetical protein